ncbi:MFS transporter [Micromonospora sp. NIE111]|nr:MFS transporter [Micromonospora hortensis]MCG5450579.1 MFS transporter [Micromonospora hortensis]
MGIWGSRIPEVRHQADLNYGTLGLALFALPLATVLSLPWASHAVERYGSGSVLRAAVLAAPVALVPVGFARGLAELIPALLLFGSALCLLNISMNARAVAIEKAYARPLMSSFHAAYSIGAIAGAGTGGLLTQLHLSLTVSLTGTSVFLFGAGVSLAWLFGDELGDKLSTLAGERVAPGIRRRDLHWAVMVLGVLAMFGAAAEGAMTDWSAVYLHDALAVPAGLAAWGLTCFSAAVAAGRLVGDRLADRWGPLRLIRVGAVVAGTGLAAGVLSHTVAGAYAGLILMGLGVSCVVPQIMSIAGHAQVGNPSRNIAIVTGLSTVGSLVGPVAIGAVAAADGLSVAVTVPAVLMLAVAGGAAFIGLAKSSGRANRSAQRSSS